MANSAPENRKHERRHTSEEDGWRLVDFLESLSLTNKLMNIIGVVGTVMNVWFFVDTLYQMRSGEVSVGLYFQAFVVVSMFLLFITLSNYKLSRENLFVILMASCYAIVLTLILISTYFIAAEVVLIFGNDFAIYGPSGNIEYFRFFESRTSLAIFMYVFCLFRGNVFSSKIT